MGAPIFPSCSYLVAVSSSADFELQIQAAGQRHQCQVFLCNSLETFDQAMSVIANPIGIVVDFTQSEPDLPGRLRVSLEKFFKSVPVLAFRHSSVSGYDYAKVVLLHKPVSLNDWLVPIDEYFASMVAKNLDLALRHSANEIFPRFFSALGSFSSIPVYQAADGFQINYSLSGGDLIGLGVSRVKVKELENMLSPEQRSKLMDTLKEATNQCLGLIIQQVAKIGQSLKLGLPTVFDLSKMPTVRSLRFFPSAQVADPRALISMQVGFIHLTRGAMLEFPKDFGSGDSGDIEFL